MHRPPSSASCLHSASACSALILLIMFVVARFTNTSAASRSPALFSFATSESFPGLIAFRGGTMTPFMSTTQATKNDPNEPRFRHCVYLGVGSNLGDRFQNIQSALHLLCQSSKVKVIRTSFLYETAPMYVTEQPAFLNGAVQVETDLEPQDLLHNIKRVEERLGRDLEHGIRNGPRPVDLDILFYETRTTNAQNGSTSRVPVIVQDERNDLIVPHPRIQERSFVLTPLNDVAHDLVHPVLNATIRNLAQQLLQQSAKEPPSAIIRVLPLPRGRMLHWNETVVMGILNVTPDSFSDGGTWNDSVDKAVERALEMERQGASIIDIGGESTRPGAKEIQVSEELKRTIPVIELIRKESDVPISIDTRHAEVARAAVMAGADIVNDVSSGTFDSTMLATVAQLGVPMILMHMRGTPETMQSMVRYENVAHDVAASLVERSIEAEKAGIHRWLQVVDPGIGFAKDMDGNIQLLKNLSVLRSVTGNLPILLGTSRKGFIGKIAGVELPEERDPGTIASCVAALCLDSHGSDGCNIVRVHNVVDSKQAFAVMDAITRSAR